ncbi:MAG: B12-binding domain-containing radical SAM protein [Kiritimatiellaeota bacterium]|nr:B12-binding domain-containing radical SAM protein [Kiritimatiellota bacterium]
MPAQRPIHVLLVYPPIPRNTYWSFGYALPFIGKRSSMPPLGLLTVAAMLPPHWEARLVDENVSRLERADLEWADVVFVSAMAIQSRGLARVAERARAAGVPVVAGGPFPTEFYDQVEGVDHFVLGEAESGTLAAFIEDFETGRPKRAYIRHALRAPREEREIDLAEFRRLREFFGEDADLRCVESRPALGLSPVPRYDLLDMEAYGSMAFQLSRGCPFSCEFCNETALFGHVPRLKSPAQALREFEMFERLGWRGPLFVVDDNFIGSIRKVKEVLSAMARFQKDRGYPFSLYTEASINLARDAELMSAMREAGFNMVFVGIETTDPEALRTARKYQNTRHSLLEDVRTIQQYGMEVTAGFIVGLDDEPDDVGDQINDFCQAAGIPTAMVGVLTPVRGSLLHERFKRAGRLLRDVPEGSNTHLFELGYVPDRNRSPETILAKYRDLLGRLYGADGRAYFARCRTLLENIGSSPTFSRKVRGAEIAGFVRSILRQPFRRYGGAYLRFLAWAASRRGGLFPEAVRLAITGHHLMAITRYSIEAEKVRGSLTEKYEMLRACVAALQNSGADSRERAVNYLRETGRRFRDRGLDRMERVQDWATEMQRQVRRTQRKLRRLPAEYRRELDALCAEFLSRLDELCSPPNSGPTRA